MYTRRFTPLKWYDRMKAHVDLRMRPPPDIWHIFERVPPVRRDSGVVTKQLKREDLDLRLIKELTEKYPDLKYVTSLQGENGLKTSYGENYIFSFIAQQKKLMKDGYPEAKAFEMVEKKFQERFSDKIESVQLASRLAMSNNARSMLTVAQQQAEFEATLKVRRMTRDLASYQKAQNETNQTLRSLERERLGRSNDMTADREENSELSEEELDQFDEGQPKESAINQLDPSKRYAAHYTRVLHKIVPEAKDDPSAELNKERRTKIIDSFIDNTKNMFNRYYERAATLDKLAGLTDKEIMDSVSSSPTKIKRDSKKLLKKLEKYNIKLTDYGEVDYSECPEPNVVNQLKNNPLVKVVLMQADLDYESPHREAQLAAARRAKTEMEEFRKEREIEAREIEQEIKDAEAIENAATGEASPFHQQFNIEYPRVESSRKKEAKESAREKASKFNRDSDEGISAEAAYRIFETYEERVTRLEKKWLQSRLASLEGGLEKPTRKEQAELLGKAVEKLRRLKYLVDQKNVQNATNLLFEEHRVFTKEEILVDESASVEKLANYLRQPDEKRRLQSIDEIDDNRILNMIRRKEVVEDTLKPFSDNYAYKLSEQDSFEAKIARIDGARQSNVSKKIDRNVDLENDEGLLDGGFVESEDELVDAAAVATQPKGKTKGKGKNKDKAAKNEKRKLIDFIKESSEKKVNKEAKVEAKRNAPK